MTSLRSALVAAFLLTAAAAHAVPFLATAPASADFASDVLACNVGNASPTATVTIGIAVRNYAGQTLDAGSPYTLQPGTGLTFEAPIGVGSAYCLFTVVAGNPKYLRAAAVYSSTNQLLVVPAR